jgi:hypothetical protein
VAEFMRGLCDADFGQRLGGKRDAQALEQELSGEQKFSTVGGLSILARFLRWANKGDL